MRTPRSTSTDVDDELSRSIVTCWARRNPPRRHSPWRALHSSWWHIPETAPPPLKLHDPAGPRGLRLSAALATPPSRSTNIPGHLQRLQTGGVTIARPPRERRTAVVRSLDSSVTAPSTGARRALDLHAQHQNVVSLAATSKEKALLLLKHVAIIGAGPAGLAAAEVLSQHGLRVTIFERMPSPARKFLMAGRGGLNLTHSEAIETFLPRYGDSASNITRFIEAHPPVDVDLVG